MGWNWGWGVLGIRRQGKEDGVEVQDGGSARAQPLVPLCLFDKSNRRPLTVKSLPRCRRGRGCRDSAPEEEQVLWQARRRSGRRTDTRVEESDMADFARISVARERKSTL